MRVLVPVFIAAIAGLVALALIIVNRPRPTLPAADRRLLDQAAALMARMANPTSLDQVDLLTEESTQAISRWLQLYNERHAQW
ncbi:hypothetical protein KBX50_04725 [Micromonospora sp. C51]|uniref:hypothetical protein n=1 Tax=Micromonospora sp. C51 TaxID=2824879 RepID=UPI001B35E9C3|nr:hypothetical protein [Micromonospora sp. C51]MBQ1047793.1 hypothetical protein [Micromonospora sp. C51]